MPLAILLASLAALYKSSELVIEYASDLARAFRIGDAAIGFFFLSIVTSLPELSVSILSALSGNVGIAVGNVFGSNVADITLVLGTAAVFSKLAVSKQVLREIVFLLLGVNLVTLLLLTYDTGSLTGFALLALFVYYSYRVFNNPSAEIALSGGERVNVHTSSALFLASFAVVVFSSNLAVENAVLLSDLFGFSKTLIGATLIAAGTSLPEVSVTLAAISKRRASMAAGNVVGSCVVNLTLVLGSALALGNAIAVNNFLNLVVFSLVANTVLVYFLLYKEKLERREGLILLGGYALFVLALLAGQAF